MGPAAAELVDARLGYGDRVVIPSVTLAVAPDEFLAVVGPNGSGKTTLLRALAGVLAPRAGRARRADSVVVGYVPQERELDPVFPLAALDVVLQGRVGRLAPWRSPRAHDRNAAHGALQETGTAALARLSFFELSAGQKQRVLLARALAAEPTLLVLDEPTAAADVAATRAMMDLLHAIRARRGLAVVVATHDLDLAANYATRIALLEAERGLVAVGAVAEIFRADVLSGVYRRDVHVETVRGWRTVLVGGPSC